MGSANPIEARLRAMEARHADVTNKVHAILRELVTLNEQMMELEDKYRALANRAQQRMMQAIAHGAKPKSNGGPSQKVAKKFAAADHKRGPTKLPERIGEAIIQGKSAKEM